jgi:hypothetical protein
MSDALGAPMTWFRITYSTSEFNRIIEVRQRVQKEIMVLVIGGRVAASSPNGNVIFDKLGNEWKAIRQKLLDRSEEHSADLKIEELPDEDTPNEY